jgi:hypothetical protein
MKRLIVYVLVLGIAAAPWPSLAHGGRAGGFGGGGGGVSHATYHPSYHAPTFSRPSGSFHTAPAGGAARSFAAHPGAFSRPAGIGAPGIAGRNFAAGHNYLGGVGGYRPNYYGNWYHGNWQGHWGRPWGAWPVGWGGYGYGGGWGLGLGLGLGVGLGTVGLMAASSPYNWGYYNYSNPYWSGPVAGMPYIDYSQPMVGGQSMMGGQPMVAGQMGPGQQFAQGQQGAPTAGLAGDPNAPNQQAMGVFDGARNMFVQHNYQAALDQVNQALAYAPKDPVLNEFRGLCLFAVGNYQQAAAADYAVLSTGPGWDWTTMSSFYPNVDAYTQQLRALEAYSQQHPQAADARFLLAYHYLREGYNNEAIAELQAVGQLQPGDQLSAQLLRGLSTPASAPAGGQLAGGQPPLGQLAGSQAPAGQFDVGQGPPGPGPDEVQASRPTQSAAPVAPESLVGDWSASRPDGSKFNLQLTGNHQFTWKFAVQDKKQTLTGTYTLADNYLILKGGDNNSLVGQVTPEAGNRFNFRMAGNNPADPGLEFTR